MVPEGGEEVASGGRQNSIRNTRGGRSRALGGMTTRGWRPSQPRRGDSTVARGASPGYVKRKHASPERAEEPVAARTAGSSALSGLTHHTARHPGLAPRATV